MIVPQNIKEENVEQKILPVDENSKKYICDKNL